MAFGQTNTGFQVGIGTNPFSTGFNSGFSSTSTTNNRNSTTKNTKKKNDYTYNSRYPGFDEEDYKRLEKMVADKGLTGSAKTDAMDQLYQIYYPQVLNKHKLDERQQEINNSVYQNGELLLNGNKEATIGTDLTKLAQGAKKRYNIPYNVNDQELVNDIVNGTENGAKLLYEYTQNGNPEIFYAAGIWDRPQENNIQRGGTRNIINKLSENNGEKTTRNKVEDVTNKTNLIGWGTEALDEQAGNFADKWLARGTKAAEKTTQNLMNKINNMSQEEVDKYRKEYEKLLKKKDWRVGQVEGNTIVGQLWNAVKGNISYEYDDEDFMKWLISQKANLTESLTGADDILNGEHDPNVIQLFGNIPASALKTFTATIRGMTNPYDSMKGIYKLVATPEGRSAIIQRYGSWDAFADALNNDPVGTADDAIAVAELVAKGVKGVGKLTGNEALVSKVNNLNIGSANDVLAQKTVGGVYGIMDNLAGDNKVLGGINRGLQDMSSTEKLTQNLEKDLDPVIQKVKKKANDWADTIIQNNNRMTKKQQENFKKMSGDDQGKWMNDRNIKTQEELVDYFLESKNKVDDAMAKIEGQFTSKELTAVLDDSIDFAKKTENKDLGRLQELQTKNANGGLTMSEINEVKRFYEKNNKFNYLKEGTAEKSALATNRDTALREWQQDLAMKNGLDNLKELNKETQSAKFLADNATDWQNGIKGNNPISLTDWIVASGGGLDVNGIKNVVGKKIFSSPRFQDKLVDVLNYIGGHETKEAINPDYRAIDELNTQKAQQAELEAYEKRILAEELALIKNEEDFKKWLEKAEYMAGPALPYNPQYDNQAPIDYSNPTVVTPGGQSVRPGQIAEI